jgi:hypothetical protein
LLAGVLLLATAASAEPNNLLEIGYRQMYNLQFDQAHRTFADWERQHPEDPMGPASDAAAYLFTEFDRLHILQSEFFVQEAHFYTDTKLTPDAALKQKFDEALDKSLGLVGATPKDANARFALVMCHGLRSDYMALVEKRYMPSFKEMKTARAAAEQLLMAHPDYYDAWIAVGVENYMLSIKPAPIRWLLKLGGGQADKSLGIEKLKLTAEHGHYLLPFARLLLAVAALRDHDQNQARGILAALAKEFPNNKLYRDELARLGQS